MNIPGPWLFFGLYVIFTGSIGLYSGWKVYQDAKQRGDPRADAWATVIAITYILGFFPGIILYAMYFFTRGTLETPNGNGNDNGKLA